MKTSIILASGSQTRAQLLRSAGVPFEQISPKVDEEQIKAALIQEGAAFRDISDTLAEYKARKVGQKHPTSLVIGSDQILEFEGRLISKSQSQEELAALLYSMGGKIHSLLSSAVIFDGMKPVWRSTKIVRLTMRTPTREYLEDYVSRNWEEIRGCVGGYQIEGEGARLFADMRGDYFTVLGMPLLDVLSYLSQRGAIPG